LSRELVRCALPYAATDQSFTTAKKPTPKKRAGCEHDGGCPQNAFVGHLDANTQPALYLKRRDLTRDYGDSFKRMQLTLY
jgi:hypothetical protein